MKCDWRARRTSSNVDVKITALLSLAFFAGPQLQLRASKAASSALLHRSPIPTYYFQDSLLRLPVPTLEETLDKYLYFLEPVVEPQLLEEAKRDVEAFRRAEGGNGSAGTLKATSDPLLTGPALQRHLETWAKAHNHTSYIADMWYDLYLLDRSPLLLNLNPQLTWKDDVVPSKQAQPARAANLVHAAARYYLTLRSQRLLPDVYHTKGITKEGTAADVLLWTIGTVVPRRVACYPMYGLGAYPLDMSQYARLFASTRIPRPGKDVLYTAAGTGCGMDDRGRPIDEPPSAGPGPRHIVIQRGPRFYRVPVLTSDRRDVLPVETIESHIAAVLADSRDVTSRTSSTSSSGNSYQAEPPVGALTSADRDTWARVRDDMTAGDATGTNKESLRAIDDALLVLTLDDARPGSHEEVSRAMLHGDGRNRWFDKCINLIVCANGRAGVSWEHAWGDGAAVLYFFNTLHTAVVHDASGVYRPRQPANPSSGTAGRLPYHQGKTQATASNIDGDADGPKRLKWHLTPSTVAAIRAAEAHSDKTIAATDLQVYQTPSLTKADIKRSGLSPDGVMQMVLQLAHYRCHDGWTPVTYESASTSAFKHGRTETIRTATPLSVAMCKSFGLKRGAAGDAGSSSSAEQRFAALQAATERHRKTSTEAVMGKGVDRHLFALNTWAGRMIKESSSPSPSSVLPAIFTNEAYRRFKDIRLSTSTLASDALDGGGFGPVSRTSYGVGYGVAEIGSHFHAMAYRDGADGITSRCSVPDFTAAIEGALVDFNDTIRAVKGKGDAGGKTAS